MKIEMTMYKENEDGSADVIFDMDAEAKEWIMTIGIESMLMQAIEGAQLKPVSSPEVTPEEDEAWEDLQRRERDRLFIDAQQRAAEFAQEFVDKSPPAELGLFTLRKAFEMGFIRGVMFTQEKP